MGRRTQVALAALLALVLLGVLGTVVVGVAGWKTTPDRLAEELDATGNRLAATAANPQADLATLRAAHAAANATVVADLAQLRSMQALDHTGADYAGAVAAVQSAATGLAQGANALKGQDRGQAAAALGGMADGVRTAAGKVAALAPPDANPIGGLTDVLFDKLVIPFEVLGILLTAAMIGALVIARPLTVHGSEETSLVHPNLTETVPDTAPAVAEAPMDAPPAPAPGVPPAASGAPEVQG